MEQLLGIPVRILELERLHSMRKLTDEEIILVWIVLDTTYTLMGGQGGADILHLEAAVLDCLKQDGYAI